MDVWSTELIRITTFHESNFEIKKVDFWNEAVGYDPEISETKPSDMSRTDIGHYQDGRIFLNINENKIDWIFVIPISINDKKRKIFDLDNTYEEFFKIIEKWLLNRNNIIRFAFGARSFISKNNKEDSYKEMQEIFPNINLDPEKSSDFQYTINRPKTMNIQGKEMTINRVIQWCVRKVNVRLISSEKPDMEIKKTDHLVTCEVDINTDQENKEVLNKEQILLLSKTMKNMTKEILKKGDNIY